MTSGGCASGAPGRLNLVGSARVLDLWPKPGSVNVRVYAAALPALPDSTFLGNAVRVLANDGYAAWLRQRAATASFGAYVPPTEGNPSVVDRSSSVR